MKLKTDKYRLKRGGYSRVLDISCRKCNSHICYYQKDGPGNLRRMYLDRMSEQVNKDDLVCSDCGEVLGVKITYSKENRLAIRLFVDAVSKKIVPKYKS